MKFYRVHRNSEAESSAGFSFFTSRAAAQIAVAKWKEMCGPDRGFAKVEEIEVAPNKLGILQALNDFAAHADNG